MSRSRCSTPLRLAPHAASVQPPAGTGGARCARASRRGLVARASLSMRYGVLGDVHGNLDALDVAIQTLQQEDIDAYLCLGDLVGYGPYPNECVRAIREVGAVTVAGNHDLISVGRLSTDGCGQLARESLAWTSQRLTTETRRYLEQLPTVAMPAATI